MNRRNFLLGSAGLLTAAGAGACSHGRPVLNVYNWSDYIAPETIPGFEREFNVSVNYGTYESNEEMLAKVSGGRSGWDIVFPSADFIGPMQTAGLLAPLQAASLPNLDNLDPSFRHPPWDPDLKWCVPYMYGATGIVYQSSLHPPVSAWRDLWDRRLAGKITMLDDPNDLFGACLKMLGYSVNSGNPAELRQAAKKAIEQKPLLRAYLNQEAIDQLVAGDITAAQAWTVTAAKAIHEARQRAEKEGRKGDSPLAFCFPSEGFARYTDTVAVLRESPRQQDAHRFLNYLLDPQVNARIAGVQRTATCNAAAHALLAPDLRDDPVLYPPAETLARGEWLVAQPPESRKLRSELWTEIKNS